MQLERKINQQPSLNVMILVQMYLIGTIIFYFLGPVRWQTENVTYLIIFVLMFQFAIYLGYKFSIKTKKKVSVDRLNEGPPFFIKKFYIFSLISIVINTLYLIRIYSIVEITSISSLLNIIFKTPQVLYSALLNNTTPSSQMFGGRILPILILLFGPITTGLIPLTIVFWSELSLKNSILAFMAVIIQVVLSVSTGTSEGYFNLLIFFSSGILILLVKKYNFRIRFKNIFLLFVAIGIGIFVVSKIQLERNQGSYSLPLGINKIIISSNLSRLPKMIVDSVVYLHAYITQGYYGLSIVINKPWTPTFGIGSSLYVLQNVTEIFGYNVITQTFMNYAESIGWRSLANWHTAYTWLANDFHWIGTLLLMFLVGYLFGRVYTSAVKENRISSVVLFTLLIMFFVFIPANNKVLAAPQTFFSFVVYLLFFIIADKIEIKRRYIDG